MRVLPQATRGELLACRRALLERLAGSYGWELESRLDLGPRRLSPELETVLYRLVQEALTNAAKHANADRVQVQVLTAGERVDVRITDDGAGLDAAAPVAGFGLLGMRERVTMVDGDLTVRGRERAGTEVTASLPLRYVEGTSMAGI